jgi:hypothetical protein
MKGSAEVLKQFLAVLSLGVDPRDLFNLANPPLPVAAVSCDVLIRGPLDREGDWTSSESSAGSAAHLQTVGYPRSRPTLKARARGFPGAVSPLSGADSLSPGGGLDVARKLRRIPAISSRFETDKS